MNGAANDVPDNGDEVLRDATAVCRQLGGLLEDLHDSLVRRWWWLPIFPPQRWKIVGAIEAGLVLFHAWEDAYFPTT